MATIFMRWLEKSPKTYDRGIQILTLGRIQTLKQRIVNDYIHKGMRVLEIGCGTGTLVKMMAEQGAIITGIDASSVMLGEALKKFTAEDFKERVTLKHMDATLIGERFTHASFDLIVSTLVFSEFSSDEQTYVLEACSKLLAPGGQLLIADEVIPSGNFLRMIYFLIHLPLTLLTWLLTRTTTKALRNFNRTLAQSGFSPSIKTSFLGESLVLFAAVTAQEAPIETEHPPTISGSLHHRVTLRTLLIDLWALFFRIIPPYPKVRTGLYTVGHPTPDSPVLVTGNFDLTVRRLIKAIDGKVNVWLLVADSAGINVWCAAGGGYFTAEKVIAALASSHLHEIVHHRFLVLPQLCANGVDGWQICKETGWRVLWGPIRAEDIPEYLAANKTKTDAMRLVRFPLKDRLEMVTVTLGFYGLIILIPTLIFFRPIFWGVTASLLGLSYFYAVVHPWLPGRDGLYKSIPLTAIALAGLFTFSAIFYAMPLSRLFNWIVGLTGLSVFVAAELQGMSPLMRGEQGNWKWEALIGAVLGLIYWLVPLSLGWR